MFKVPEQFRSNNVPEAYKTEPGELQGLFDIPIPMQRRDNPITFNIRCIASSGMGWEHVSVVAYDHNGTPFTPFWEIMCKIKDCFWDKSDTVIQYHPAEKDYVNMHPNCLHLWRPTHQSFPIPPSIMVGVKTNG